MRPVNTKSHANSRVRRDYLSEFEWRVPGVEEDIQPSVS